MYDAIDVARYIIQFYRGRGVLISNLKLQKLLYYIQGECLADDDIGEPCFHEPVEAWKHGPVVRDVYDEYSNYMAGEIQSCQKPAVTIDEKHQSAINSVLERYQDTDPWELVEKTHRETPWLSAYWEGQHGTIIPTELIRHYFRKNNRG